MKLFALFPFLIIIFNETLGGNVPSNLTFGKKQPKECLPSTGEDAHNHNAREMNAPTENTNVPRRVSVPDMQMGNARIINSGATFTGTGNGSIYTGAITFTNSGNGSKHTETRTNGGTFTGNEIGLPTTGKDAHNHNAREMNAPTENTNVPRRVSVPEMQMGNACIINSSATFTGTGNGSIYTGPITFTNSGNGSKHTGTKTNSGTFTGSGIGSIYTGSGTSRVKADKGKNKAKKETKRNPSSQPRDGGPLNESQFKSQGTNDVAAKLRRECAQDDHISINGQSCPFGANDIKVEVEGQDLVVNGQIFQNFVQKRSLTIIQDRKIRNIIVNLKFELLNEEKNAGGNLNSSDSQSQQIHLECNGNLHLDESPPGCMRIICVDVQRDSYASRGISHNFFGSTSYPFIVNSFINYNESRGNLNINNLKMWCVHTESDGSSNIKKSQVQEGRIENHGTLNVIDTTIGSATLINDGTFKITKSIMDKIDITSSGTCRINEISTEKAKIDSSGTLEINSSKMGDIELKCSGSTHIYKTIMKSAILSTSGSFGIKESSSKSAKIDSSGSINISTSKMNQIELKSSGSSKIGHSEIKHVNISESGLITIVNSEMETGEIRYNQWGANFDSASRMGSVRFTPMF